MKNIAIICEYNPMHKGHIEQIRQIKEHFPDSNIIALMSGSFVQRGHAAILDKFSRAQIAIENGIDLVLEMPTIVSLQSADYFSYYSVKILDKLGVLDYLSFGIECEDAEKFIQTEEILAKEADSIDKLTKEYISNGLSYKQAYQLAVKESIPSIDDNFFKANNTLALGYCKALRRLNSNIDILPIHRKSADYNSDSLSNHPFQSATAIRKLMRAGEKYSKFVADRVEELYIDEKINEIEDYSQLFYYQAIVQGKNPDNIAGYENGMLNLLINNFEGSIVDAINKSHNKRYTISRLRRF